MTTAERRRVRIGHAEDVYRSNAGVSPGKRRHREVSGIDDRVVIGATIQADAHRVRGAPRVPQRSPHS